MTEVRNLWKGYEGTTVLKGVDLTVHTGEIHGLIGENSAGKTTLIKCVTGIFRPDQGTILYDGQPVYDNPAVKERIGYVADSCGYISLYTVAGMVDFFEAFYPRFDREKFNDLNEVFRIPVKKRIFALSKGQKMRLSFMMEVSKQPDYLILDEPTSGLDPVAKTRLFELLIREVEQREVGVLISSHNLEGLERICDNVTMLHQGKVEYQMSMEDMKCQLTQLNVVFEGGAGKALYELPEILKVSNVGSIYTLVVRDYGDGLLRQLKKLGAGLVEPVDISLEDLFVALQESREDTASENPADPSGAAGINREKKGDTAAKTDAGSGAGRKNR